MPSSVSAEASPLSYDIVHTTRYRYSDLVSVSHHVARLTPRTLPQQTCVAHDIAIEPAPANRITHTDYFGNTVAFFGMQGPHRELTVSARSRVRMAVREVPESDDTPAWEAAANRAHLPLEAVECLFDSPSIRTSPELAAYASPSFTPGRSLVAAVADLTRRIFEDFTFDPRATTITTPLSEVFALKRGVCQDFARLEIGCLRSMGLAAHYVSGYLETLPPPGTPRRIGADASHAWLAVYCPGRGWIDVDPTNNLFPTTSHVTLAWGRDYVDVSPIRGVILGGGDHALHVSVDVVRVEAEGRSDHHATLP
jgi:transglutaminase-like putative cysteine protease